MNDRIIEIFKKKYDVIFSHLLQKNRSMTNWKFSIHVRYDSINIDFVQESKNEKIGITLLQERQITS